jgi:hypothetical protein
MVALGPQAYAIEQNKRDIVALPRIIGAEEHEDEEDF